MTEIEYTKDEIEYFELMHWAFDYMQRIPVDSLEEKKYAEEKLKVNLEEEQKVKKWAENRTIAKLNYKKQLYYDMYHPKDITCTNCQHTAELLPETTQQDEYGCNCPVYICPQCKHSIMNATPVLLADRIKIAALSIQAMIKLNAPAKVISDTRQLLKDLTEGQKILDASLIMNEKVEKNIADIVAEHMVILIAYKHNALTGNKRNDVN